MGEDIFSLKLKIMPLPVKVIFTLLSGHDLDHLTTI